MIRNLVFVFLIILILIFVVQNTQVVEYRFLVWTISMSRAMVIFGTMAIGFIAGWFLTRPKLKKERENKRKDRK